MGRDIVDDLDGRKIGTIEAIYFDEQTSEPQWMVVKTGMFGTRHRFVPLDTSGARPLAPGPPLVRPGRA